MSPSARSLATREALPGGMCACHFQNLRTRIHKPDLQLSNHRLRQGFEEVRFGFPGVRLAEEPATDFDDVVLAKRATHGVNTAADFGVVGGFPGRDLLLELAQGFDGLGDRRGGGFGLPLGRRELDGVGRPDQVFELNSLHPLQAMQQRRQFLPLCGGKETHDFGPLQQRDEITDLHLREKENGGEGKEAGGLAVGWIDGPSLPHRWQGI